MTTPINNSINVGNSLYKRVGSSETATNVGSPAARSASYGTDNLVRTGATNAAGASANATATAALDRLATCYDANPEVFAHNLAEASLNDVARQIG